MRNRHYGLTVAVFILCILLSGIVRSDDSVTSFREAFIKRQMTAVNALEKIDPTKIQIFLFSIDPSNRQPIIHDKPNVFYGFPILGRVEIKTNEEKEELFKAFIEGVRDSDGSEADCFNPRHGMRLIQGDQKTDFVVCYSCLSIDAYNFGDVHGFLTSGSPAVVFNRFLDEYHIKKADPEN